MVRRRDGTTQHNTYDEANDSRTGMKIKVTFVIILSLESNGHVYTSPDLDHRTVLPGRKHNTA
jgi:hypothetical protein